MRGVVRGACLLLLFGYADVGLWVLWGGTGFGLLRHGVIVFRSCFRRC